jgi:hypothetical protein
VRVRPADVYRWLTSRNRMTIFQTAQLLHSRRKQVILLPGGEVMPLFHAVELLRTMYKVGSYRDVSGMMIIMLSL